MHVRHSILASLVLLLAACNTADKYPYPLQFTHAEHVPPQVIEAPYTVGSRQYTGDVNTVLARQATLTDAQKAALVAENHITPSMLIYPVLGERYSEEHYPQLYQLLKHAGSDAWRLGDTAQDYWASKRPWMADSRVQLLVPSITRPGYPSGHTTTNMVWAHVLSELFPAKRTMFFARALEIGQHRIDGGAHFPHDVTSGQKLARAIYREMQESPAYHAELSAARAELKAKRAH